MDLDKKFKVLETKHNLRILMYLHMCGPGTKTEIYNAVSTNPRMPEKLNMLVEHGLVEQKINRNGNRKVRYDLTPKGRKFTDHLCGMSEDLGWNLVEIRREFNKGNNSGFEFQTRTLCEDKGV